MPPSTTSQPAARRTKTPTAPTPRKATPGRSISAQPPSGRKPTPSRSTTASARSATLPPPSTSTTSLPRSVPTSSTAKAQPNQQESTGNWLNRSVQNSIAGVGQLTGGLMTSVGDGVNRVGQGIGNSITNTTRTWGQGVAGYGNQIKDSVGIGGPRVATAGNPLGLAGQGSVVKSTSSAAGNAAVKGRGGAGNHLGL